MNSYFGDEYPAAITRDGERMPLVTERRWTRVYAAKSRKLCHHISRFMDGSAAITFEDFAQQWPSWDERERNDFCDSCSWLHQQVDYPEFLRYIMEHGGPSDWSAIANSVGTRLPQDEAFDLLSRALHSVELSTACNLAQGISLTKHPGSEGVLHSHLTLLWSRPSLWDDDEFINWIAYGATCCIEHLIAVGASPEEFTDRVRALAKHPCAGNRDSCRRALPKYFPWLIERSGASGDA